MALVGEAPVIMGPGESGAVAVPGRRDKGALAWTGGMPTNPLPVRTQSNFARVDFFLVVDCVLSGVARVRYRCSVLGFDGADVLSQPQIYWIANQHRGDGDFPAPFAWDRRAG